LLFNSVYFIQPNITNYTFASKGFTVSTHSTALPQDLTPDQETLPRNKKNLSYHVVGIGKPDGCKLRSVSLLLSLVEKQLPGRIVFCRKSVFHVALRTTSIVLVLLRST